jgi:anaerobic ribonucleoside-triphosphate reductase activating protein
MQWASIRKLDISNGEGIGIALFVQGCHFHCKDCFNSVTWDFEGGKKWTEEVENKFISLANRDYIKRISILGGEPLAPENIKTILNLINRIRDTYGDTKKIWLYSGYYWDEIFINPLDRMDVSNEERKETVKKCDFLVDGRFETDLKDFNYQWAGSTNQTVIDVKDKLDKDGIRM